MPSKQKSHMRERATGAGAGEISKYTHTPCRNPLQDPAPFVLDKSCPCIDFICAGCGSHITQEKPHHCGLLTGSQKQEALLSAVLSYASLEVIFYARVQFTHSYFGVSIRAGYIAIVQRKPLRRSFSMARCLITSLPAYLV